MRLGMILVICLSFPLFSDEPFIENQVTINLQNPNYTDGTLSTTSGGVIENNDIRIQAKSIRYTRKGSIHTLDASGDLLVQHKKHVYVGEMFHYNFGDETGYVTDARTSVGNMYVGAARIDLNPDGSFEASEAFMTDAEQDSGLWDLRAEHIKVEKNGLMSTSNTKFRIYKVPVLWLPYFKMNLVKFPDSILDYGIKWDSAMGPRASVRYQLYSWRDLAVYGRVEYRWAVGWGGAFETEYFPEDSQTRFVTRSYIAKDRLEPAPNPQRRYRLIGDFKHVSKNERTTSIVTWDKYSDVRMESDFVTDDFELNRAKKTIVYLNHRENSFVTSFKFRPRANSFESIKQDLPTGLFALAPIELGRTGIYSSSLAKASYLDFAYSDQLVSSIPDYHSGRVELREKLYRPINLGAITITPLLGGDGIFYTNSPTDDAKWFGVLNYGLKGEARAIRNYNQFKHQIEPYIDYSGLSRPSVSPDNHYIFSIQDGLDKINQVRLGFKNLFFDRTKLGKEPFFKADLAANAFFADFSIPQVVPYGYLNLNWNLPSVMIDWQNSWNFRQNTLQYSNARLKWTLNENIAFSLEGRYRSSYDWRKSDHDNFILDVSRSQSELLLSPLSDRRVTILTNLFVRITPFWEAKFQSHHGFLRKNQDPYNELMLDLTTWLSSSLKLNLSYRYTDYTKPNFPHHFTANIELVK
jgi:hypothetical protein